MALIDLVLKRRAQSFGSRQPFTVCQPRFELLEVRECMSVTAPTGLHLTAVSSTQVKITWNNVASASGYIVYRWDGTQAVFLAQISKGGLSFTTGGLLPNQTQWFAVTAFDNATTAQSAWQSITTLPDAITVPTKLTATATSLTSVTLGWTPATGETGYRIFGWNGTTAVQVGTATASQTAFVASNLTAGTTYYFYLQAFNNTNSASTDWVTVTTPANSVSSPSNLKTKVLGPSTIQLNWTDSTGETGYKVYQWNGNSAVTPVVIATLAANVTSYQAIGLVPGGTYWFYVQAYSGINVANSIWVNATTTAAVPLQAPTNIGVQIAGTGSVIVSWTNVSRAVGYRVFVWANNTWTLAASVASNAHQATVTGLGTNQTQWFMVESYTDNFAEFAFSGMTFINL